ncbi:MAG: hypothetical protein KFF72_15255, partial [Arthrospira sp. SH-MAG29]
LQPSTLRESFRVMIGVVANASLTSIASRKAIAPQKSQVILLMGGLRKNQGPTFNIAVKYKKLIKSGVS